jgi:hypothetical protein
MVIPRISMVRFPDRCRSYGAARVLIRRGYKYFAPTELVTGSSNSKRLPL